MAKVATKWTPAKLFSLVASARESLIAAERFKSLVQHIPSDDKKGIAMLENAASEQYLEAQKDCIRVVTVLSRSGVLYNSNLDAIEQMLIGVMAGMDMNKELVILEDSVTSGVIVGG